MVWLGWFCFCCDGAVVAVGLWYASGSFAFLVCIARVVVLFSIALLLGFWFVICG